MTRCVCCGAALLTSGICNETILCSANGCFLRWLTQDKPYSGDLEADMSEFVCDCWVVHHGSTLEGGS